MEPSSLPLAIMFTPIRGHWQLARLVQCSFHSDNPLLLPCFLTLVYLPLLLLALPFLPSSHLIITHMVCICHNFFLHSHSHLTVYSTLALCIIWNTQVSVCNNHLLCPYYTSALLTALSPLAYLSSHPYFHDLPVVSLHFISNKNSFVLNANSYSSFNPIRTMTYI